MYDTYEETRILLSQYVTGSHCLEIETGKWRRDNERKCKLCGIGTEDLTHFILICPKLDNVRRKYALFPNSLREFFKWNLCPTVIRYLHRTRNKYGR